MTKILILQGGFNEEHKVSLNTSKEIIKTLKKLKIHFKTLNVNPITFEDDILEYSNDYICFNALHGTFGEDGKLKKILTGYDYRDCLVYNYAACEGAPAIGRSWSGNSFY